VRINHRHTAVLDTEFLFQHLDLVERALQIPSPPRSGIRAAQRDATRLDNRRVRERDNVVNRHFDAFGPRFGKRSAS